MRVLVIAEDPTHDRYILRPVIENVFDDIGRTARVEMLENPRLRGVNEALRKASQVVRSNPMVDLFVLALDRDGEPSRSAAVKALEDSHPGKLFACLAVEEVEVWMLALYKDALGARWSDVRDERDPKERFAAPFLAARGWDESLGGGRAQAMRSLPGQLKTLLSLCPELAALRDRLREHVG